MVPTTMRGIPLEDLLRSQVTRGFYITEREPELRTPGETRNSTESPTTDGDDARTEVESESTNSESTTWSLAPSNPTELSASYIESSTNSIEESSSSTASEEASTENTTLKSEETSTVDRSNRRREKFDSEFGERSSSRVPSVKQTEDTQTRRRVVVGRRRRPVPGSKAKPIGEETLKDAVASNSTGNDRESLNEDGTDRFEAEVNSSKNTSAQSPGSLLSTRLRKPVSTQQQSKSSNTFTNHRKNRPTGGEHSPESEKLDAVDKTTETAKLEKDIDQSSRAQEIAVTLADPPPSQSSTTGRPALRNAFRRKISTTIAPRSDATTTTTTTTSRSTLRFTPVLRGRQKPRSKDKPVQNATTRPRRPQVIDYDYYEDEEESVIGKSTLNGKLFLTSKGSIRCLDQGNFPHPYSCRKFITCARMVNGMVVGAEYTCPDKLSFDPVGGICNWSAGLGCKD